MHEITTVRNAKSVCAPRALMTGHSETHSMAKQSKPINCFIPVLFLLIVLLVAPPVLSAEDGEKNDNSPRDLTSLQRNNAQEKPNPCADADISIKVIPSVNNTYGYDILLYKRPFVHQPNIPGLPGNEGFATKERAKTVAEFVVKKIRNGEMPPTVSVKELEKMGVLK
jgi:hypothetical protein